MKYNRFDQYSKILYRTIICVSRASCLVFGLIFVGCANEPVDQESIEHTSPIQEQEPEGQWSDSEAVSYGCDITSHETQQDLFLVDLATGKRERITNTLAVEEAFSVSPNGSYVAYTSLGNLCIYDLKARAPVAPQSEQIKNVQSIDWSPDGDWLLFSSGEFNLEDPFRMCDLYKHNLESGESQQLTNTEARSEVDARWSPDGSRVVYISRFLEQDRLRARLETLALGSGNIKTIDTSNIARAPSGVDWSFDGSSLVVSVANGDSFDWHHIDLGTNKSHLIHERVSPSSNIPNSVSNLTYPTVSASEKLGTVQSGGKGYKFRSLGSGYTSVDTSQDGEVVVALGFPPSSELANNNHEVIIVYPDGTFSLSLDYENSLSPIVKAIPKKNNLDEFIFENLSLTEARELLRSIGISSINVEAQYKS